MAATPTPGGISERSIALPVGLSGEAASISRWWRMVGGVLMTLALGTLYAWSVFVAPLENEFGWKRAQTSSVFTLAVVMFAASLLLAGKLQDRFGPFWISLDGKHLGQSELFTFCVYVQPVLSLLFLRRIGRHRDWIRFRNRCSRHGQMVSRPNGIGHRTRACRIWRRIGHFRHVRKSGVVSALWLAHFLHDPQRNFSGDDHDCAPFC